MRHELEEAGRAINVVAINASNAVEQQHELVTRCAFPLLQDTSEVGAWSLHSGKKDDIFVYDAQGLLVHHLPVDGDVPTSLSTPAGYEAVKTAILEAFEP